MTRNHTLFTGQWVDLDLEEICTKAASLASLRALDSTRSKARFDAVFEAD